MDGMRHDQSLSRCPVPKDNHAAMMEPTYHSTLNYTDNNFMLVVLSIQVLMSSSNKKKNG